MVKEPVPLDSARRLGVVIRQARNGRGLTQEQLAKRAHVERQWLALLESGSQANPTLGKVLRTLTALDLELQVAERASMDGPDLASLVRGSQ